MVNKKAALVRRLIFLSPYPHAHGGLFRVHPLPEFSGHLRNRNMIENEKIDCVLANCEGILPLSKSLFPLLQHASSIIAEGYEHACEISELAFTAPAERLFLDCDSAEQAAFNKNIARGIGMSNLRTLRQSIAYSPTQNVKARAGYLQPLPVIDPRDWQGKPVPERQWFLT
jgi:hypothetical protein